MENKVRELRKAKGMSQTELASKVSFTNSYVSQIERNDKNVNQQSVLVFCDALECTPNELFGWKE